MPPANNDGHDIIIPDPDDVDPEEIDGLFENVEDEKKEDRGNDVHVVSLEPQEAPAPAKP